MIADDGLDGNLSPAARESLYDCTDNHIDGCPCLAGGDVELREVVIEANDLAAPA